MDIAVVLCEWFVTQGHLVHLVELRFLSRRKVGLYGFIPGQGLALVVTLPGPLELP